MAVNRPTQFGTPTKGSGPRRSQQGRVCSVPGCTTVLSIYNDEQTCASHASFSVQTPYRPADRRD